MYLVLGIGVIVLGFLAYMLLDSRRGVGSGSASPATGAAGGGSDASSASSKRSAPAATSASGADRAPVAESTPSAKPAAPRAAPADDGVPDLDLSPPAGEDEPLTVMTRRFAQKDFQEIFQTDLNAVFPEPADEGTNPTMPFSLFLVSAIGQTDVGRKRKHNEDNYLIVPEQFLFVIADGMGGHAAGEVASALTVETIAEAFKTRNFDFDPNPEVPRRGDELVRAIRMANRTVFQQAMANPEQAGMGTTVVAARYSPNKQRVYIAHVGDSRLYRLRGLDLVQMTTDHTLESQGVKGPEGAKLTRAVGVDEDVLVDLMADEPMAGDQYLICSDGLTKMLKDVAICEVLLAEPDIETAVRRLIQMANDRGGKDNITVILVRVVKPDLSDAIGA